MANLDSIPSLIPLPPQDEQEPPPSGTSNEKSDEKDHLADLLTGELPSPIFPSAPAPAPAAQPQPIPIGQPRAHAREPSDEFGSFTFARAQDDPLNTHDLLAFTPVDSVSDTLSGGLDFLEGAQERVDARRERVVKELEEHEDEPMYWHARRGVGMLSPEEEMESGVFDAMNEPLDTARRPSPTTHVSQDHMVTHPTHPRRAANATDPGPSTSPSPHEPSSSPSRYDSLRRTLSRPLTSLFAHSAASLPTSPPTHSISHSPSQSTSHPPILPSSSFTHSTPFAPHHASTLPPSGAPGFLSDEQAWDTGGWSKDPGLVPTVGGASRMERIGLEGRNDRTSPVLSTSTAALLRPYLPPLSRLPRTWTLLYSLDQHGISLSTFYARIAASFAPPTHQTGGCLLAIRDARSAIFGVWLGERIHPAGHSYYGSGESFLWKLDLGEKEGEEARVRVFKWTGKNEYVALCEEDYISFGGGDGRTGLYLDGAFDRGTSERCPCFDNEPLCWSADGRAGRFACVGLEVWRIGI